MGVDRVVLREVGTILSSTSSHPDRKTAADCSPFKYTHASRGIYHNSHFILHVICAHSAAGQGLFSARTDWGANRLTIHHHALPAGCEWQGPMFELPS